jgi:glutamyl/glutaminyl-tRNA synthetase
MLKIIKFRFSVKLNHNHNVRRPLTVTGLRNYLYKYILVKQYGGTLNLVLEDRKEKSTEAEPDILQCLEWLRIGPKSDA